MSSRQLLELDFPDYKYTEDLIGQLRRQEIDGIIFREFMSADKAFARASWLQSNPDLMRSSPCPYGRMYARTLVGVGYQLERYFDDAQVFKQQCDRLFASPDNFEIRFQELLRQIGGGRNVKVPLGPFGKPYAPMTIRWIQPEGAISPHCENLYFGTKRPEFDHLHQLVESTTQFSFFMPLTLPQEGGELVLYALDWEDFKAQSDRPTDSRLKPSDRGNYQVSVLPGRNTSLVNLEIYGSPTKVTLAIGDLIIFDAGRIWHRVSKVKGTNPRITIGGFICFSSDDQTLYYFS